MTTATTSLGPAGLIRAPLRNRLRLDLAAPVTDVMKRFGGRLIHCYMAE